MPVFRIEKTQDFTVMSNHHLRNTELSLKAKGLLCLMLSLPDNWDYTINGLATICKDGIDAIRTTLKELEQHGYLTRNRIRNKRGHLTDTEYVIHEKPQNRAVEPKMDVPILDNPTLEKPILENPIQLNTNISNTKESNTNLPTDLPSAYSETNHIGGLVGGDIIAQYTTMVSENVEADILAEQYGGKRMSETVDLIVSVLLSTCDHYVIRGEKVPAALVQSQFQKLKASHIQYAFDYMDDCPVPIDNIKGYLISLLYNATFSMSNHYAAKVNYTAPKG